MCIRDRAGTDAIEAALKLVKTATGRADVLAFQGAYHGMTQGALQLMGNTRPKQSLRSPLAGCLLYTSISARSRHAIAPPGAWPAHAPTSTRRPAERQRFSFV